MNCIIKLAEKLYSLKGYDFKEVQAHKGGRNKVYIYGQSGENKYVLRISDLGDRKENDYLAEAEFVRYLVKNGAPVSDIIPSVTGKLVESVDNDGKTVYIYLFAYAKGMLI